MGTVHYLERQPVNFVTSPPPIFPELFSFYGPPTSDFHLSLSCKQFVGGQLLASQQQLGSKLLGCCSSPQFVGSCAQSIPVAWQSFSASQGMPGNEGLDAKEDHDRFFTNWATFQIDLTSTDRSRQAKSRSSAPRMGDVTSRMNLKFIVMF